MYTFTFRISANKKMLDEHPIEITIQAPGYYDDAVITKKDEFFPCLELMSSFWTLPVVPPCGGCGFSFNESFSPFDLFYALKHSSDCYFELETDYSGDLTKWPSEEKKERKVIGIAEDGLPIVDISFSEKDFIDY